VRGYEKIFYGWWIVLACFIISLYLGGSIFFGFTAFFEPLRKEFGWSYTQISFAASLRGLEMGFWSPIVGFLVDHFGSRKLILAGVVAVGLALVLLSLTQSLAMFYVGSVLLAFGAGGCASVVTMTVVANWFHKKVGVALGIMASGFGASGLIVPLIVWLIDVSGWRSTFFLLGLGMWILGIPLSLIIRNRPEQYGYLPDGQRPELEPSMPGIQEAGKEMGFKEALGKGSFLYLNVAEGIRMMTIATVATHVMPYLKSLGVPRSTAALVAAGIPLFSIIGRFGFGWLGDAFDKRMVMGASFCFMGLGLLAFCYVNVLWVLLPFLLFFSPGFGGAMVVRGSIIREYFGRGSFGKMIGITMGAGAIGGIIGPTVAGWVFDVTGSYRPVWFAFMAVIALTTVLIAKIR